MKLTQQDPQETEAQLCLSNQAAPACATSDGPVNGQ